VVERRKQLAGVGEVQYEVTFYSPREHHTQSPGKQHHRYNMIYKISCNKKENDK
jgi:hypothetical protein